MAMNVGELVAYLNLNDTKYRKGLAKANKAAKGFGKTLAGAAAGIAGLGAGVQVIGGLAAVVGTAAGALPVLAAGAVAAKFGMTALTVATDGFGDAMSSMDDPAAFAQAIAELSPAARDAANAVRDLKPAWDAMTDSVQEKAFAGLAPIISKLGGTYLPILGDSFGRVGSAANAAARGIGESLSTSARVNDVTAMTGDFASAWENVLAAAEPLVSVLLDVGAVASSFLPGMTDGAKGAAQGFADMVSAMRDSGELYMMMQRGLDILRKLGEVAGNVGEILGGIFRAADTGGASFIDRLVAITQRIADMVNSVAGQAALSTFFQTAATLSELFLDALDALLPVLPPLVEVLGTLAVNIGTLLVGALTAIAPYLEAFARWATEHPGLVMGVAIALGVLVGAMNLLLGVAKIVGIVQALMATGFLGMLASAAAAAFGWAASWATMAASALASAASMAAAWLISIWPIALVVAAVAGLAALIYFNWEQISAWTSAAWTAVSGFISDAWNNITSIVTGAVATVTGWVTDAWNTITSITSGAWTAISGVVGNAWNTITSIVNGAVNLVLAPIRMMGDLIRALMAGDWAAAGQIVSNGVNSVTNFVGALPGRILGALGNIGSLLWNSGVALISGFWNGLVARWNQLMAWVRGAMANLRALWPFSPAKTGPFSGTGYVTYSGRALTADFADSLLRGMPGIIASARQVVAAAHAEFARSSLAAAAEVAVPYGSVTSEQWAQLRGMGYKGRRGDSQEALYVPQNVLDQVTGRGGGSGVTVNIYNPQAERSSDAIGRAGSVLAAVGPWGDDY